MSEFDFSCIDDIDAQALSEVLTPQVRVQNAAAGSSACIDESLLLSPRFPMSSGSGSDDDGIQMDDDSSISCGDSGADSQKSSEQGIDIEMGMELDNDGGDSSGLEVEGCDNPSLSPTVVTVVGERDWLPGANCGQWVAQNTPIGEQASVFIVNACMVASRLPSQIVRAAVYHLHSGAKKVWGSYSEKLVASLLCINERTIRRVLKHVQKVPTMWNPCSRRSVKAGSSAPEQACRPQDGTKGLSAAVRMAVAQAAEGRSAACYQRDVMRNLLNGWETQGPGSAKFAQEVAGLAAIVLAHMDAIDFEEPIPGLGIPSDFCMLADPVSIGESICSRHGDLLVICLSLISARTGRFYNPMLSAPAMKIGEHGGDKCAEALLQACQEHPVAWTINELRARLAGVGGDGALCSGGPDARHKSSGAAEKLWALVHRGIVGALQQLARPLQELARPLPMCVPTCTSWDPFHRADVAMWRSVRKHPQVLAIFDVSKEVDYLFGQSEGVLIFRGVAAELGEIGCNVRAPGGTRKVVYLSGVPGSLLQNYKIIRGGFHARVAWRQAGHSKQTIHHLLDLGRRMSEPQFCVALSLLDDILGGLLQPFAKQVQATMDTSVFYQVLTRLMRRIDLYILSIRRLRVLLRVMSLCRQHLTSAEAVQLCMAFGGFSPCSGESRSTQPRKTFTETSHGVSPATWRKILRDRARTEQFGIQPLKWGSCATHFPTFFKHVETLLDKSPTFQDCEVVLPSVFNSNTHVLLGAHCQCTYREAELLQQWDAARLGHAFHRPKGPVWVAYQKQGGAGLSASDDLPSTLPRCETDNLLLTPPRCITLPKKRKVPPQIHSQGMFRHGMPRCKISHREFLMDQAIDTALLSISAFLVTMKEEMHNIFTSVGVNDSMSTLLGHVRECWDWERLAFERPTAAQIRAFRSVVTDLEPLFQNTLFPVLPGFENVPRYWKNVNDLCIEYVILCERVRRAMGTQCRTARGYRLEPVPDEIACEAKQWITHASCKVSPIFATPSLLCSLLQKCRKLPGSTDICLLRILGRVTVFLNPGSDILLCFAAGAGSAAQPTQWTGRPKNVACGPGRYQVALQEIHDPSIRRCRGKRTGLHRVCSGNIVQWRSICAEVMSIQRRVDVGEVAATIAMHRWFAVGSTPQDRCAWGASRALHRSRVLTSPDSCCEAIGAWMRYHWNPRKHSTPQQVADGVFLAQAGVRCIGGQRDEVLVAEVTRLLQDTSSYIWQRSSAKKDMLERHIAKHNEWVRNSGRYNYEESDGQPMLPLVETEHELPGQARDRRKWLSARGRPNTDLPVEMQDAVRQSVNVHGRVGALQLDVQHLHARQRGATSSVMHERLCNWLLNSKAGQEWKKERAKMLQADDQDVVLT